MTHCPVCSTVNGEKDAHCRRCGHSFAGESSTVVIEPVDAVRRNYSRRKLCALFLLLLLIALPWLLIRDLLTLPPEVREMQEQFVPLRKSYQQRASHWIQEKNGVLKQIASQEENSDLFGNELISFRKLQPELLLAYLADLGMNFDEVVLLPIVRDNLPTLFISKQQTEMWPLSITLSMQLHLEQQNGSWKPQILHLRRGARTIPNDLAWNYFSDELNTLRNLIHLAAGTEAVSIEGPILTWDYRPQER